MRPPKQLGIGAGTLLAWACVGALSAAVLGAPPSIPDNEISALEAKLAQPQTGLSSVRKRLACKSIIRKGNELLEAHPSAPNRYRVWGIIFKSQKRLLVLQKSDRTRDALFDTCKQLAQAPDEYAELRLEADLLLSEKALAAKEASIEERSKALRAIMERYRDTPAEARCLILAAKIASKLEDFELEKETHDALRERFADDPKVIAFIRKNLGVQRLDVLFSGTFERSDGVTLSFPIDTMGHTCLMYFWSRKTPDFKKHLLAVKQVQSRQPGRFEVYSFNLDELPDAGKTILRSLNLDWSAMKLPGGRRSLTYRTYATQDPLGIRINAHGHAMLRPTFIHILAPNELKPNDPRATKETPLEENLDDTRYLSQLQSLLIGDFLLASPAASKNSNPAALSVPPATLDAIGTCFPLAPMRYRLSRGQALANYTKAEKLSRQAVTLYPKAPNLWAVRNHRIIALLGMWNLAAQPRYLEDAANEARTALAGKLPAGADIIPRFCLAKAAFRKGDSNPRSVLTAFVEATGAADAPVMAHAAASILAMDINARDLHDRYREIVLTRCDNRPAMWPVVTFLRDQNHTFRMFRANYYLPPSQGRRAVRGAMRGNAAYPHVPADANRVLEAEFNTFTGGKLRFPRETADKLTLLLFVEPPTNDEDAAMQSKAIQSAVQIANSHVNDGVDTIAAFFCDDQDTISGLMKKNAWACRPVMVPDGLANPLVRQLGILSADRIPNAVLLRRDGTIAWTISGLLHPQLRSEGIGELAHVISIGLKTNINWCEMDDATAALQRGEFQKALRLFAEPLPSTRQRPTGWTAPQLHGRSLANIGLKQWDAALADIDAAIDAHQAVFNHGNPCTCKCVAGMRLVRARILDQLGRAEEAQAQRKAAAGMTESHRETRYGMFHKQLNALTIKAKQ